MLNRKPDFENNLLKVLRGERPDRATLFELFFSRKNLEFLAGETVQGEDYVDFLRVNVKAMEKAGYDYASCHASNMTFASADHQQKATKSLNDGGLITDWESFERYNWPDMDAQDYSRLERIKPYLPEGMTLMVTGPCGVLENVISIVGYDHLCYMLYEDPELVKAIFDAVGSRLVRYYEDSLAYDTVGIISSNDDWGFNTQTFLSPADMRKYLFPWHKKIVETAHKHGRPVLLHSCGCYAEVIDDIIDDLGYDARHSYEDNIIPVEQAYENLHDRIAVLGGIDIHFLATATPGEIYRRCRLMLERTSERGGYALGSGNSIADFVPNENLLAMISAAHDFSS
jgi:uroporphyrinogen decarboxylase